MDGHPLWIPAKPAIIRPAEPALIKPDKVIRGNLMVTNLIGFGAGSSETTGNDAFTKVLLHFDGADTSTTITDSNLGGSPHTWTANGNAAISTAQSKFGGSSCLFDGTGDDVSTADSNDYSPGSSDFTIDCWFWVAGGSGARRHLMGHQNSGGTDGGIQFELSDGNVLRGRVFSAPTTFTDVTGTTTITTTGWHHGALVRTGNTLKLFLDGSQEGGDVAFSSSVNNSASGFRVGSAGDFATLKWNGHIDEFRYSIGIARWTANFTPPTVAYS